MHHVLYIGDQRDVLQGLAAQCLRSGLPTTITVATSAADSAQTHEVNQRIILAGGFCDRSSCYAASNNQSTCPPASCYAEQQWAQLQNVARSPNVSLAVADLRDESLDQKPESQFGYTTAPTSKVAQLTSLLLHRWRSLCPGVTVIGCTVTKTATASICAAVVAQAEQWRRPQAFLHWLTNECSWVRATLESDSSIDLDLQDVDHPILKPATSL